jgi:hypothetical protein
MVSRRPSASSRPTPCRPALGPTRHRRAPAVPAPDGQQTNGANRVGGKLHTVVLADISTSARRDTQAQRRMRCHLYDIVSDVVQYAGLEIDSLPFTDTGDGMRLLLPVELIKPTHVVDLFVLGLNARLRDYRRDIVEAARIRLRVAFDLGVVESHLHGWAGDPLVRAARLVEAEPLREALRADLRLDLAVVVSDVLYEAVVRHGYGYIGPSCFRAIHVRVKEFDARAWRLMPGATGICGQCGDAAA